MRYALTLGASSSLEVGRTIASNLTHDTTESARTLYSVLLALAFDTIDHNQYAVVPQFVTFHSSLTLIAAVCGVSRWTTWRALARLKALGVVDYRAQKGKLFDKIRNTGSVFQVRLDPLHGTRAKLSYQDMNHRYKDLTALARSKRLSHQTVQHIQELQDQSAKYLLLKEWTLKTYAQESPVVSSMVQGGLEAILAVSSAQGREVAERVDSAAVALAKALQDTKSTDFYRKLLWALKRRLNASLGDEFHTVYQQVNRVIRADMPEWKGLRSPGALLVSRLKKYPWFDTIMTT